MANKGLSMRKVREVLRLHHVAGLSGRAIARSLKVSPATATKYISRAEEQGLGWPLPESLDDAALERLIVPGGPPVPTERVFEPPAVEALFQGARGLPRQINRIAHYALSAAALDNARTVNADHLQHALEELRP